MRKLAPLLPLHHNPPDGLLFCNSVYFICARFENIYQQQNGFEQRSKDLYMFIPFDVFLWRYYNSEVSQNNPQINNDEQNKSDNWSKTKEPH